MSFVLKQFEIGPMQNFCYLIGDEKSREAFVVDPAWAPKKIMEAAKSQNFKIKGFLVTHAHYDHTNAIEELLKEIDVPVYAHRDEITYAQCGEMIVGELGKTVKPVMGGDKIKLGETEVEFLATPGHTPGSQCIRVGDQLITGDTLFIGACGRSDLPGGNPSLLFKSLQKLATLPDHLTICPGHDYGNAKSRLLKDELKTNPYLRLQDEETFLNAVL
jgi:glyoxylase-like metal-dependent hydrolase (beta-lactamase superfamily II)